MFAPHFSFFLSYYTLKPTEKLPKIVAALITSIFKSHGFTFSNLILDKEGRAYDACTFKLDDSNVVFRKAKITPTKTGQFVTLWKRNDKGNTAPFDVSDPIDLYLIATQNHTSLGLFIFPKAVLHQHKILSNNLQNGKKGFRVYPPWDKTYSKQASATQEWQSKFFSSVPL